MNDPFWIFAIAWGAGMLGAGIFNTVAGLLYRWLTRDRTTPAERRIASLRELPRSWPQRPHRRASMPRAPT